MSHAEVFDRQIGLIEAPRAELIRRLLEVAEPMPGLRDFFTELQARGGEAAIVSAGIREAIEAFWEREQLPPIELFASELVGEGPDGGPPYHLEFSDALGDCPRCGPKSCKAAILRRLRRPGDVVLVFGDGPSDLCPAREADLVVRARPPGRALRAGGPRVAAAHRLRRRARRGRRVAGAPVSGKRSRAAPSRRRASRRRPAQRAGAPRRPSAGPGSETVAARRRRRRLPGRRLGVPDLAAAREAAPGTTSSTSPTSSCTSTTRRRSPQGLRVYKDFSVRVPAAGAAAVHAAAARRPGVVPATGSPPR